MSRICTLSWEAQTATGSHRWRKKDTVATARVHAFGRPLLFYSYISRNESFVQNYSNFRISGPDAIDANSGPVVNTFSAAKFASLRGLTPKFQITSANRNKVVVLDEDVEHGTKKLLFKANGNYDLNYYLEEKGGRRIDLATKTVAVTNTDFIAFGPVGNVYQSYKGLDIDFRSSRGGLQYTLDHYTWFKNQGYDPKLEVGKGEGKMVQTQLVNSSNAGRFFFYNSGTKNLKYTITANGTKKTIGTVTINLNTITIPDHIKIDHQGVEVPGVAGKFTSTAFIPTINTTRSVSYLVSANPNKYAFLSGGKYYHYYNFDNKYHQMLASNNPEWEQAVTWEDIRPHHSSITTAMKTYRVRRMKDGTAWMLDNIRYVPPVADLPAGAYAGPAFSSLSNHVRNKVSYSINTSTEQVFYSQNAMGKVAKHFRANASMTYLDSYIINKFKGPCPDKFRMMSIVDVIKLGRSGSSIFVVVNYNGSENILHWFDNPYSWSVVSEIRKFFSNFDELSPYDRSKKTYGYAGSGAGDQFIAVAEQQMDVTAGRITDPSYENLALYRSSASSFFTVSNFNAHLEIQTKCVYDPSFTSP